MDSHRKKTAKQSLKQRRTKMLCSRLERIRRGKTYGGTCRRRRDCQLQLERAPFVSLRGNACLLAFACQ